MSGRLKHWITSFTSHTSCDLHCQPETMRKPLLKGANKLLCGLADPWTSCSDEDKVRLLSVLGLDDDSQTSQESLLQSMHNSCLGVDNLGLESSCTEELPCDPSNEFDEQIEDKKSISQQLEWVFTLYDFDRKGRVTKADIASLVRSIYEVLGTTKIALNNDGVKGSGDCTGAFKIKLTVMAGDNCTVTSDPTATPHKHEIPIGAPKMGVKRRSHTFPPPTVPMPCTPNCSKRPRHVSNKENQNEPSTSTPRKQTTDPKTTPNTRMSNNKTRTPVAYRDYVNLSELEACCSAGLHQPYPGVHHIRHCDRHCHHDRCCHSSNAPLSPPSTHFFHDSCSSTHERKHRNRDKDRQRAMQLVHNWIGKDGGKMNHMDNKVVKHEHIHHHFVHHS